MLRALYTFHKYLSNIIINKKDIKNISINFILYLFNFNNSIDFNNIDKYYYNIYKILLFIYNISIYKIKLKIIHNELKYYFKQNNFIHKIVSNNDKLLKDIKKSYKKNDLIINKSNQIIIKYKYIEKYIKNQFIKHYKIQEVFNKNIVDQMKKLSLSIKPPSLIDYLIKQLNCFFPDDDIITIHTINVIIGETINRLELCFKTINLPC